MSLRRLIILLINESYDFLYKKPPSGIFTIRFIYF
jgi:hypothetical protein